MLIKHIAIVSETPSVELPVVSEIAAAIQKQVMRDFAPVWQVQATVAAFASLANVPSDYWPVIIRDDIKSNAAGIHWYTKTGQPYALVDADANVSITCSHEVLEMLADPFGNRMIAGPSLKPDQGRVNYLVEVCDPSEAHSYPINGIAVSDFYLPVFFSPVYAPGTSYSFMGVISQPRQVLRGGYISWMIPETGVWWQQQYFGTVPIFKSLGVLNHKEGQNWRGLIDAKMHKSKQSESVVGMPVQSSPKSNLFETGLPEHIRRFLKKNKK